MRIYHAAWTMTHQEKVAEGAPPCTENPDDDMSDAFSFTLMLPKVFKGGNDDLAPLATGPWMIINHFTGKMIVDDEELPPVAPIAPGAALDSAIQVKVVLCTAVLVQTLLPTLLFTDQDVHPDWLIRSTKEFLQHVPYYMCLDKVVDLFFAQEANLSYPAKVSELYSLHICLLTTLLTSLFISLYHLRIDLLKLLCLW